MRTIALSMRLTSYEGQNYTEKRDSLALDWINYMAKALPTIPYVTLPNMGENITTVLSNNNIGGIVLTGGDDIGTYKERDITEIACIEYAIKHNVPLIGICRGAQMINHYFKGTLVEVEKHAGTFHNLNVEHEEIPPHVDALLLDSLPEKVNSYHNHAITLKTLAKELCPLATNEKSTVELFAHRQFPLIGIMWHPERNTIFQHFDMKIFQSLFLGI